MAKYYFGDDQEHCYTLDYFIEQLDDVNPEITVYPAKILIGEDVYYCKEFGEVGEVGDGCGKDCNKYEPRNGKNGRCRYSNNCYEPVMDKPKILCLNS